MICPLCTQAASTRCFQKHGYWILECQQCQHRYADLDPASNHVEAVYGDHYFHAGGDGYPDYLGEADLITRHAHQYGQMLKQHVTPGQLLDVGAAAGFILKGFQETGWAGQGLEPNDRMAHHARTQLGLAVQTGTLETFQTSEQYDVVSFIQVIAHFYDLQQALQAAAAVTRPGGFWLIESWNRASFVARILGRNWHEYSPPSVLHWFSPDSLQTFVAQFGFQEVARGRPAKRLNGAHAKSLLGYKLQTSPLKPLGAPLLKLIPDALTIPYPTYDLFWGLYQK